MDAHQHALAAEIRGEMAARRITAKAMQRRIGVSSSAWNNYFVSCTRDVPMGVLGDVARELGMPASELMRRAEVRAPATTLSAHIANQLSPADQEIAAAARGALDKRTRRAQPNG